MGLHRSSRRKTVLRAHPIAGRACVKGVGSDQLDDGFAVSFVDTELRRLTTDLD